MFISIPLLISLKISRESKCVCKKRALGFLLQEFGLQRHNHNSHKNNMKKILNKNNRNNKISYDPLYLGNIWFIVLFNTEQARVPNEEKIGLGPDESDPLFCVAEEGPAWRHRPQLWATTTPGGE